MIDLRLKAHWFQLAEVDDGRKNAVRDKPGSRLSRGVSRVSGKATKASGEAVRGLGTDKGCPRSPFANPSQLCRSCARPHNRACLQVMRGQHPILGGVVILYLVIQSNGNQREVLA